MDSIISAEQIERIEKSQFWNFHGGIHPPEQKELTNNKPIRTLSLPEQLIIPLQQHIGEAGKLIVEVGDYVLKGQPLTQCNNAMAVPIHAPTSGTINAIKNSVIAHPSGMQEPCLFLTTDGEDKWRPRKICNDYTTLSPSAIIEKIIDAGISGMGGAGFPTHIKVNTHSTIETLIINAAECEPYITADDLLIKEHSTSVIDGINILDQVLTPTRILIGIEDNKLDAIEALKKASVNNSKIQVCVIPTKYPSGGEKQLIKILTGQEVPKGALPNSIGIVMQNVATCFAVADAVINDIPLIKRVVTVTGFALEKPQNVWALLGTTVGDLLSQGGYKNNNKKHVIMGGPMMGFSLPSPLVPIVKTSNCILAPSEEEISMASYLGDNEVECIRCGECAEVCPSQLLPQELQWSAKAKDHNQLNNLNLFDCIECGACAYVCPSQIPLVNYYRVSKAEIRQQKVLDLKAEKAKVRFEARKLRLEREKKAREEKQRKAAEARKARMNANTAEAKGEKSAVAAALARVKAKKAQQAAAASEQNNNKATSPVNTEAVTSTEVVDEKQQVSAAIARAKEKKLARTKSDVSEYNEKDATNESKSSKNSVTDKALDKKAKIAAAIAKAKAKKTAGQQAQTTEDDKTSNTENTAKCVENTKKDTNKAETLKVSENSADNIAKQGSTEPKQLDKKARIAAAVAKAKAKKLAEKNAVKETKPDSEDETADKNNAAKTNKKNKKDTVKSDKTPLPDDLGETTVQKPLDKKARIAAAVAKAKAKKLAQANSQTNPQSES